MTGIPHPDDLTDGPEIDQDGPQDDPEMPPADSPTIDQSGSEGVTDRLTRALLRTEPNPDLEDVTPFDLTADWDRWIARGIMKVSGSDGIPAVLDLMIGVVLAYLDLAGIEQADDQTGEVEVYEP